MASKALLGLWITPFIPQSLAPHSTQLAKCNRGRENRTSNPYLNLH